MVPSRPGSWRWV